jgi:hypothetical protein
MHVPTYQEKKLHIKTKLQLGVVVYFCNPSYFRGGGKRIVVQGQSGGKSINSYLKNKLRPKGLGVGLKW